MFLNNLCFPRTRSRIYLRRNKDLVLRIWTSGPSWSPWSYPLLRRIRTPTPLYLTSKHPPVPNRPAAVRLLIVLSLILLCFVEMSSPVSLSPCLLCLLLYKWLWSQPRCQLLLKSFLTWGEWGSALLIYICLPPDCRSFVHASQTGHEDRLPHRSSVQLSNMRHYYCGEVSPSRDSNHLPLLIYMVSSML